MYEENLLDLLSLVGYTNINYSEFK